MGRYEAIQIDFVEGKRCPWKSSRGDFIHWIVPHQSDSIAGKTPQNPFPGGTEGVQTLCKCQKSGDSKASTRPGGSRAEKDRSAATIEWFDPRDMPFECLHAMLDAALDGVVSDNVNIGVLVPGSPDFACCDDEKYQHGSISPLQTTSTKKVVWYPCLSSNSERLKQISAMIDPAEVFPIIEFPENQSLEPDETTPFSAHIQLLEDLRVRTEKIIYLNPRRPESTYRILGDSFSSLQRSGSISKVPLASLGGTGPTLAAIVLASIVNSTATTEPGEILFPSTIDDSVWGYAIARRIG